MYKTELHCHSDDISSCARVNAEDIVKRYSDAGYSTVVLTNHFNYHTIEYKNASCWNDFIDMYICAYEKLKECAFGKFNVLLGFEFRFPSAANDYLVFGLTEKELKDNPHLLDMPLNEFHEFTKSNDALLIQAHPFRYGMELIDPSCLDGIEVFNGHLGHNSNNDIASVWADKYNLIKTSGTDFHYINVPINAGIGTESEITSEKQLVGILKSGNYSLINKQP